MSPPADAGQNTIPVVIFEEHHEAFFIWNYAVKQGWIDTSGNVLLHVDEHADLGVPSLRSPVSAALRSLDAVARFTYTELAIRTFIVPALYQGLFAHFIWLRRQHAGSPASRKVYVYSEASEGRQLKLTRNLFRAGLVHRDGKGFQSHSLTEADALPARDPLILDIDLDYFLCQPYGGGARIEISASEYQRLRRDPYHPAVLQTARWLQRTMEEDGHYYLCLGFPPENQPHPAPESVILQRIESFGDYLKTRQIRPRLIGICRSRFSGFTPPTRWRFIEARLLEILERLYGMQVHCIREMIDPETVIRPHTTHSG